MYQPERICRDPSGPSTEIAMQACRPIGMLWHACALCPCFFGIRQRTGPCRGRILLSLPPGLSFHHRVRGNLFVHHVRAALPHLPKQSGVVCASPLRSAPRASLVGPGASLADLEKATATAQKRQRPWDVVIVTSDHQSHQSPNTQCRTCPEIPCMRQKLRLLSTTSTPSSPSSEKRGQNQGPLLLDLL